MKTASNEYRQTIASLLDSAAGIWSVVAMAPEHTHFRYERLPDRVFPSASLIKVLILAEVCRQTEAGLLSMEERLDAPASKTVPFGLLPLLREQSYSVWDLLIYMMTVSDNTATNLLIDRVGMNAVNQLADALGLAATRLRRHMMDLQARRENRENETSPRDMAHLFSLLHADQLISPAACKTIRGIMGNEWGMDGLRRSFPHSWNMMRKTGELDGIRHDVCLVQAPSAPLIIGVFATDLLDEREGEQTTAEVGKLLGQWFTAYWAHYKKSC